MLENGIIWELLHRILAIYFNEFHFFKLFDPEIICWFYFEVHWNNFCCLCTTKNVDTSNLVFRNEKRLKTFFEEYVCSR